MERIEAAAASGQPTEELVNEVKTELEQMQKLSGDAERAIAERLAAAATATDAKLSDGRGKRGDLLLDLEIALSLPTPPAQQDARRARQLGKLQEHFGHGSAATLQPEQMFIRYHAAAGGEGAPDERMAPVMRKLMEQGGK